MTNYIPIIISAIAIVIAFFSLYISVISKTKERNNDSIEKIISLLESYLEKKVHECIASEMTHFSAQSSNGSTSTNVEKPKMEGSEPMQNDKCQKDIESENPKGIINNSPNSELDKSNVVETKPTPYTLYVGSYTTGEFKHTSSTADEKTIYTISLNDKNSIEGIIRIFPSAYDKVAITPDYLKGACIVSGSGNTVNECNSGIVIKDNGQWKIKEQIEVKLVN